MSVAVGHPSGAGYRVRTSFMIGRRSHPVYERDANLPEFSIVVPILEEDGIGELSRRLAAVMDTLDTSAEVVFVDDGSQDRSPELLARLSQSDSCFKVVRLSRNIGHQVAIMAALHHASGRAVVVMDGDLQDPREVIPELVERWRDGIYEEVKNRPLYLVEELHGFAQGVPHQGAQPLADFAAARTRTEPFLS